MGGAEDGGTPARQHTIPQAPPSQGHTNGEKWTIRALPQQSASPSAQDKLAQTYQPSAKTHGIHNKTVQPNNNMNISLLVDTPTARNSCLAPTLKIQFISQNINSLAFYPRKL